MATDAIRPRSTPLMNIKTDDAGAELKKSQQRQQAAISDAFFAYNPMAAWMNAWATAANMFSPLGYGAMRGPLGY